jgi:hypothetical protein
MGYRLLDKMATSEVKELQEQAAKHLKNLEKL